LVAAALRNFWWLLRRAVVLAWENGGFGVAKAAAYSALLSFFPLLTATATILVDANAEAISRILARALFEVVPPGTESLVEYQLTLRGARPSTLLVAASLISIWAATGFIASLMEGFRAAYHIPVGRSVLRERGIATLLVFAGVAPLLGASALIVLGERVERRVLEWLGVIPAGAQLQGWVELAGVLVRYGIALGAVMLVTAALYRYGPNRPQRWRLVFPGAVLATLLWLPATLGFAWYVRNIADYNLLYGSIGAVIALLVWMYVLSAIALIGCEFNAELERTFHHNPPAGPARSM
jgi:membrane protein